MNVVKMQRVGKLTYAIGRKYKAVEQKSEHGCDGCVAQHTQGEDKTLSKYKAMLCMQLPDCGGVYWEEV